MKLNKIGKVWNSANGFIGLLLSKTLLPLQRDVKTSALYYRAFSHNVTSAILPVFCVTPFKKDENQNQNRSIDKTPESGEMKGGEYASTLPKIQVRAIFRIREIFGEVFHQNLLRFVWRRHAGAHQDGHQRGGQKPTETSVTSFPTKAWIYLSRNSQTLKRYFFLIHDLFR